jgi:hypothetical protein
MTKDKVWDPSKYDSAPSADADWFAALAETLLWNRLMVQLVRLHGTMVQLSPLRYGVIEGPQQHLCVWC